MIGFSFAKIGEETRLFALSRTCTPRQAPKIVRAPWDIVNGRHRKQDAMLHEDYCTARNGNGPGNLALLRRITANTLTGSPDKASIETKRLKLALNEDCLATALTHRRDPCPHRERGPG